MLHCTIRPATPTASPCYCDFGTKQFCSCHCVGWIGPLYPPHHKGWLVGPARRIDIKVCTYFCLDVTCMHRAWQYGEVMPRDMRVCISHESCVHLVSGKRLRELPSAQQPTTPLVLRAWAPACTDLCRESTLVVQFKWQVAAH